MKLFKLFIFMCTGVVFATGVPMPNPYETVYDAYMNPATFDADNFSEAVVSIQGGRGGNVLHKQALQKTFFDRLLRDLTKFEMVRECSYSNINVENRLGLRGDIMTKIDQRVKSLDLEQDEDRLEDRKIKAFKCLLKIDAFQDENWQEVDYHDNFYALLCSTIKDLRPSPIAKFLQEWKAVIWQEERKEAVKHKFTIALQGLEMQRWYQRLADYRGCLITFLAYVYTMSKIEKSPMEFLGNSSVQLKQFKNAEQHGLVVNRSATITPTLQFSELLLLQGSWAMNLLQQVSPDYAPVYFFTTLVFCITVLPYIIPMIHQLDYGFTYFARLCGWNEKINTEELTNDMVNAVFEQTKNLTAKDFDTVVDGMSAVLPELLKRRQPLVIRVAYFPAKFCHIPVLYPVLTNSAFNKEFEKEIQTIIKKVKKTVSLK